MTILPEVADFTIDRVTPREQFEVRGKNKANLWKKKGYEVKHQGRDKYISIKKLGKRDIFDMGIVRLSIQILLSGHERLVGEYLKKVLATESAMSYLLYRFILELRKAHARCMAYGSIIKFLLNHGARFTIPVVVKSYSIFTWALLKEY